MSIKLQSDSVRIAGPKIDGSYSVTFNLGEYMQQEVAQLMMIPQNTNIKLEVEVEDE